MKRRLSRPSPALVIASLALILAVGGTSYAAIKLPKNSVGSKQIKKNAVTSKKVKNGSLRSKDFKAGQLPAGSAGPTGPTGASGPAGKDLTAQSPLPSGKSESGFFAAGGGSSTDGYIADNVQFVQPLSAPITAASGRVVYNGVGVTTANCPGPGQAAAGYLCFYANEDNNVDLCCIYDFALNDPAIDTNGGIIYWGVLGSGSFVSGSWTVTAA